MFAEERLDDVLPKTWDMLPKLLGLGTWESLKARSKIHVGDVDDREACTYATRPYLRTEPCLVHPVAGVDAAYRVTIRLVKVIFSFTGVLTVEYIEY